MSVFNFNVTCVQGALVWKHAGGATTGSGLPNPIVHTTDISARLGFERDVSPLLPFCYTSL